MVKEINETQETETTFEEIEERVKQIEIRLYTLEQQFKLHEHKKNGDILYRA